MKGVKGLLRLSTLTLLTLMLTVTMALSASAAKVCSTSRMLPEVEIVSVEAKPVSVHWRPQDLVKFKYNGDIENGLLEVRFKDIPDPFDFDGYIIEAVSDIYDPDNSDDLVGPAYTSPFLIARPPVVGDTVTEVLNLEPGIKYYVTIYAVNHNTVQISPDQRAQDSSSATTLLSAPFLGALDFGPTIIDDTEANFGQPCVIIQSGCSPGAWRSGALTDSDYQGTHFALYDAENEAGQHYFHWLNPVDYGPFDHVLARFSDLLFDDLPSPDNDGDVADPCDDTDINSDCSPTHYQFKAVDGKGNTVASELVETNDAFTAIGNGYFRTVFTAESGDLILSVSLGRMVDGKYKAMSDTASVRFQAPDDLRALDQTYAEYLDVLSDIRAEYLKELDDTYPDFDENTDDDLALLIDDQIIMVFYLEDQLW